MVWKRKDPQGNEAAKIKWELVEYTRGRVLDIGAGMFKAFPHFISVDNCADTRLFGHPIKPDVFVPDATDLSLFASDQFDAVFSSHLLEHIPQKLVVKCLREWLRVIKAGGHLLLYLPDETLYPKVGEEGANRDHKWNVSYLLLIELMKKTGVGWDLVDWQRRDQDQEYSLFMVFRKVKGTQQTFSCTERVQPAKTCAVVRYGAYGDLVQASSVLAGLKREGYHVTLYTSTPQNVVMEHDPNIDRFFLQDRDQVPNAELGAFWAYHAKKYDKWVNLSESVERTLLALPQHTPYMIAPAARHKLLNMNYVEFQHAIAGVEYRPENHDIHFFATPEEKKWAQAERRALGGFVVAYALNGSSVHKRWPWMDHLIAAGLVDFPDLNFVLVGGEDGQILEQGWFGWDKDPAKHEDAKKVQTEPRVHCRSGRWDIRQTLSFLETANLVFGPETGVLNAAASLPMPKIVLLSHSSVENLPRDWVNCHALASADTRCPGRGENEAPACHQMHYSFEHCRQVMFGDDAPKELAGTPMGVAQCQYDLSFEEVYKVFWHAVTWEKERLAAVVVPLHSVGG
jgi:ADP-heptose:LPS heptosyltransferase/predicted SAM-dependent methyltransferase